VLNARRKRRPSMQKLHELRTWPEFFKHLITGEKTFEIRRDDRAFRAGDIVNFKEYSYMDGYTGREFKAEITYLLTGHPWGIKDGYIILAIKPISGERDGLIESLETDCKVIYNWSTFTLSHDPVEEHAAVLESIADTAMGMLDKIKELER